MGQNINNNIARLLIDFYFISSDTIDAVKQSAALTLLRLLRTSPDLINMGEWTSRVIHLLNDQHMVCRLRMRTVYHSFQWQP